MLDDTPPPPPPPLPFAQRRRLGNAEELLRAARRAGDVSQRELAAQSGVTKSVIARIETGDVDPSFGTILLLLAGARCELLVLDPYGIPLSPAWTEHLRDQGGRRWPAHLDVRRVDTARDWWFGTYPLDGAPLPSHTYDLARWARNLRRRLDSGERL